MQIKCWIHKVELQKANKMHFYIGQNIRQNGSETKVSSKKRIDFTNNDEGTVIQLHKECGVGIDCHSKFLQISVIVKAGQEFKKYQHTFPTDPKSIDAARKWVIDTIEKNSVPPITVKADTLSYSIESTSTYHLPVVQRWGWYSRNRQSKACWFFTSENGLYDEFSYPRSFLEGPSILGVSDILSYRIK